PASTMRTQQQGRLQLLQVMVQFGLAFALQVFAETSIVVKSIDPVTSINPSPNICANLRMTAPFVASAAPNSTMIEGNPTEHCRKVGHTFTVILNGALAFQRQPRYTRRPSSVAPFP